MNCYICDPNAWTSDMCEFHQQEIRKYMSGINLIDTKPYHNYEKNGCYLQIPYNTRPSPFYQILVEAADLHARKNSNYAGKGGDPFRNFKECEDFNIPAWKGVLVRLSDKWMRIKNLADGVADEVGEDITETLIDLLVYAGICICLIKGENE